MPGWVTAAVSAACACKSQLASLLACQMPLKLGLPPMLAGRVTGAWADAWLMATEMPVPTATAAMATVIIERRYRSCMNDLPLLSFDSCLTLLQRIFFEEARCIALGIRT